MVNIRKVEAWFCILPLPHPINLGRFVVKQRSHLALRLYSSDGLVADCVTQARGTPLDLIVMEMIAPQLLGRSAIEINSLRTDVERSFTALECDGAIGRAWSAVEICLQDLRAQALGWPLWRLLGGRGLPTLVELIEGYELPNEADEVFAERLVARVAQGFKKLKIEAGHYTDTRSLLRRLELFRREAGDSCSLVLDFAWTWNGAKERLRLAQELDDFNVEWLEDPFPRTDIASYRWLRQNCSTPIGCGDEATRVSDLLALMEGEAIDVIRIDATTIGGIETLRQLTAAAASKRLKVSYHEHPEVHEHCVFGLEATDHVEVFPADRPFDRVHELLHRSSFERIRKGWLHPSDEPGTNIRMRDDVVTQMAVRHQVAEI